MFIIRFIKKYTNFCEQEKDNMADHFARNGWWRMVWIQGIHPF